MSFDQIIRQKLHSTESLLLQISEWKNHNLKIVFTNGCFDLLHPGHIDYLSQARLLGDKLIIGLNSDKSVERLKGPGRPVNSETDRAISLAAFYFVDAIVVFDEETPQRLISDVLPDILVKGGDYSHDTIVGADLVENNGGKVVVLPFLKGYSSTNIINKILKSYSL